MRNKGDGSWIKSLTQERTNSGDRTIVREIMEREEKWKLSLKEVMQSTLAHMMQPTKDWRSIS